MVHLSEKAREGSIQSISSVERAICLQSLPRNQILTFTFATSPGEVEIGSRYAQHGHYLNNEHGYPHFSCFRVGKIDQKNILLHFQFSANLSSCLEIDSKISSGYNSPVTHLQKTGNATKCSF
jgi:hypothetical protein